MEKTESKQVTKRGYYAMSGTNLYSEGDLHPDYEIGSVRKKKRKEQTMRQTDMEKHLRGDKSELRHE